MKFPTPAEQEAQFLKEWQEANPELANRAAAPEETLPKEVFFDRQRMVLEAAQRLTPGPFRFQSLAALAFVMYPKEFALEDYPEYPDVRKIATVIYGRRGLIARGLIEVVRRGMYRVTTSTNH